jgi:hypothetical protein
MQRRCRGRALAPLPCRSPAHPSKPGGSEREKVNMITKIERLVKERGDGREGGQCGNLHCGSRHLAQRQTPRGRDVDFRRASE